MTRGAKITLGIFLVLIVLAGLTCGSWFIFRSERAVFAAAMIDRGDSFLAAGDLASALISYKKAEILTPRSFAPYFKQGLLAKDTGHFTEAINYINKSTRFYSNDVNIFIALGDTYLLNNEEENAKAAFNEAKKIDPQNDEVIFRLVEVSLKENELDEAEDFLTKAGKSSSNPKYTIYLALIDAFNDPTIRQKLEAKGEPFQANSGGQTILETATLRLVARVVDMTYGQGALPESSYFDSLVLELAIWQKQ